jgi:hypothetical protein
MLRWLSLRKVLGWSHLLGGVAGGVHLGGVLLNSDPRIARALPDIWYLGTLAFFGLSVVSGLTLLRRPDPYGRPIAAAIEGLQLIGFHTGSVGYTAYSGLQVLLIVTGGSVQFSANANSQFWLGAGTPTGGPFVALDLLTLVSWYALWRFRRDRSPLLVPLAADEQSAPAA